MDVATLAKAVKIPQDRAAHWLPFLENAMDRFGILTPMQQAAFLSQTAHESKWFQKTAEDLYYSTPELIRKCWPFRFRTVQDAKAYCRDPEGLANFVYQLRNGNGDEASGDGFNYRGRGLIQLTGRENYRAAQAALNLPLMAHPELLEQPAHAAMSAAWYWHEHNLNRWADLDDINAISGLINRGDPLKVAMKQEERREGYVHALEVLEGLFDD